jgi:glyoxylase-like metal-dependent hydrolase (beta-lactamase superfamily II)
MEVFMKIRNFPDMYMGANSYLVVDDEQNCVIIDAGVYSESLAKAVKIDELKVHWLILTHGHGDHIGGAEAYLKTFEGCKLAAGIDEKQMLNDPALNMTEDIFGAAVSLEADRYLEDGEELTAGGLTLKCISTPGHTPGGICLLIENVLFSGDTLFQGSIGRTDFPGGSFETLINSIKEKLFVLPDETNVYPGHMGATNIGFEKKHNPFL